MPNKRGSAASRQDGPPTSKLVSTAKRPRGICGPLTRIGPNGSAVSRDGPEGSAEAGGPYGWTELLCLLNVAVMADAGVGRTYDTDGKTLLWWGWGDLLQYMVPMLLEDEE